MTPYFSITIIAAVINLGLAVFVWSRNPDAREYRLLAAGCVGLSIWMFRTFEVYTRPAEEAQIVYPLLSFGSNFAGAFLADFLLQISNRPLFSQRKYAVAVIYGPIVLFSLGYIFTTDLFFLGFETPESGQIIARPGPLYFVEAAFVTVLPLIALVQTVRTLYTTREEQIRKQLLWSVSGLGISTVTITSVVVILPEFFENAGWAYPLLGTICGMLIPGTMTYAIARYGLAPSIESLRRKEEELKRKEADFLALQALRQAAVHQVRAEISTMRTTEDLEQITPLIWRTLQGVGVTFLRSGVLIMDQETDTINVYLANPSGGSLAAMHLPFDSHPLTEQVSSHWADQTEYVEQWDRQAFTDWMEFLDQAGQLGERDRYLDAEDPPEQLTLHFVPFRQGMLYVGSAAALSDDDIGLVEELALAFSVAYARYLDFEQLEAQNQALAEAKERIEQTLKNLRETQAQLMQAEKMASLGQLTAGIAHEINNPINFVSSNIMPLQRDLAYITQVLEAYAQITPDDKESLEKKLEAIENLKHEVDYGYLQKEIQGLLKGIQEGAERTANIVRDLQNFSRHGEDELQYLDINEGIETTLTLLKSHPGEHVTIERDLGDLPEIEGYPGQLNQVWMNLMVNGLQAMGNTGVLRISTETVDTNIRVCISDTGVGMSEELQSRIFDPFFTTKDVGEGTGLGLSISYGIIESHQGNIEIESEVGRGTRFIVTLPTRQT